MKIDIFSHCTIDTIIVNDSQYEQPGGAACYCGLTAKNLGFDVALHTKFGSEFPKKIFDDKKIHLENELSEKPTTKFTLKISNSDRELFLNSVCESLEYSSINSDGVVISPIFNEISIEVYEQIKKDSNFVLLDPQGFLRRIDNDKKIYLEKTNLNFSNISAIKVNSEEIENLTGAVDVDAMKILQKKGIEHVIHTNKRNISMLVKDKIYSITLPNLELYDTTGIGDIFSSTFCCTMLKEKDFLWALSFAGGAAQAALESKKIGLEKVPPKGAIVTNAAYFYNQIKFKQV